MQFVEYYKSNPKRISKSMYNFLKKWLHVKEKKIFLIYIYDELIIYQPES